ncbi:MAG TPA: cysteine desulfurase family protein [Acidimicrobiales bacterium]
MTRHYLDHASTTPPRPQVIDTVTEWLGRVADPGRVHTEGLEVRAAIESARDSVAALVGARNREVVFCSGATEAVNAAVWGAAQRQDGPIVVSAVEHSCVREAAERTGRCLVLGVDSDGCVDLGALDDALTHQPALVCVQWANHEVGTVQPIAEVAARCQEAETLLLVDAAMAAGHIPVTFDGIDLLAITAHKIGGPPGIGALVVRRGLRLPPLLLGGAQERARRAGLENVPAIMGFSAAAELAEVPATAETAFTSRLRTVIGGLDGVKAFGPDDPAKRVSHIACFGFDDVDAEPVLVGLDRSGIAAHSGSSCSSELIEPSPVLAAMGAPADRSLRLSVGWTTTDADIAAVEQALPKVLAGLRALR